jgi:hypothetical protein
MLITRFEAHVITNLPFAAKLALTLLTVVSLILPARVHQIYRAHKSGRAHVDSLELGHPSTA